MTEEKDILGEVLFHPDLSPKAVERFCKWIRDLKEKAEKWNELCEGLEYGGNTPVRDILQEITLIDRDNKLRRKKLEAIEGAFESHRNNLLELSGRLTKIAHDDLPEEYHFAIERIATDMISYGEIRKILEVE